MPAKGDEERIRDAGAEGYVSKPISVLRFVEAVRTLLEAAAARAAEAEAEPESLKRRPAAPEARPRNAGSGRTRRRGRCRSARERCRR